MTAKTSFEDLAAAFKRQFGSALTIDDDGVVDDDDRNGVQRVGSVRSNWLKRNAPKYGYVRVGDSATIAPIEVREHIEAEPAVAAETSEIEAVTGASEALSQLYEETADTESEPIHHINVTIETEEDDSWPTTSKN